VTTIHRLTTGRVRGPRRSRGVGRYLKLEWSEETLPVHAYLVDHPAGLCLVDAGQSPAAGAPGYLPRWHPFLRIARFELAPGDDVRTQLERIGHRPDELRWIVLTHLHTDHVGGLADVAGSAEVIVSAVEWQRARGVVGAIRGYVPKQWPAGLVPRLVRPTGPPDGPFTASLDLVQDASLRLVPLTGHTPGQIGLLVGGTEQRALIGGDVAHDWPELQVLEPSLAEWCCAHEVVFLAAHDDEAPRTVALANA
jgi:glyoxylase-like metal-dependent hydrolase (beta-lactamase superfamily II)